jgi:hypothetical protein
MNHLDTRRKRQKPRKIALAPLADRVPVLRLLWRQPDLARGREAVIMDVDIDCFLRQVWWSEFEGGSHGVGLSVLVQVHPANKM